MTVTIQVPLEGEAAEYYEKAPPEVRRKIRLLLSLWVQELALEPRPIQEIMDEIAEKAARRGLTPEILESLLDAG